MRRKKVKRREKATLKQKEFGKDRLRRRRERKKEEWRNIRIRRE